MKIEKTNCTQNQGKYQEEGGGKNRKNSILILTDKEQPQIFMQTNIWHYFILLDPLPPLPPPSFLFLLLLLHLFPLLLLLILFSLLFFLIESQEKAELGKSRNLDQRKGTFLRQVLSWKWSAFLW
jgi:hypothetical protein